MRDKKNDEARLELMKEAIANIEEFMLGVDTFEAFQGNKVLTHAIVFNLQCIGENVYKLSRPFLDNHPEIDWEAIEGLRHLLVHDYYNISLELLWEILDRDLPVLKKYLNEL